MSTADNNEPKLQARLTQPDKDIGLFETEALPLNVQDPASLVVLPATAITSNSLNERVINALVMNVSESTRKLYRTDALQFAGWISGQELDITNIGYEGFSAYRSYLSSTYTSKATAARKLVVARRLLNVAVILKLRLDNPGEQVPGFKNATSDETPHRALTTAEAKALLATIDTRTIKGIRDHAIIRLLIRTGIRRAECSALKLGDLVTDQGHNIAVIRHGKGDKRRVVKLQVEIKRELDNYCLAVGLAGAAPNTPLFQSVTKSGKLKGKALTGDDIEQMLEKYVKAAELVGLTPHGLRATFVTLSLEGGAKLQQVQYAAGHADPRTTERYQRRKLNLDDNASDYVKV